MCGGGLTPVGLGVLCAAYHAPMLEVTTRKNCRCRGDGDPSASYPSTSNGNDSCNVVSVSHTSSFACNNRCVCWVLGRKCSQSPSNPTTVVSPSFMYPSSSTSGHLTLASYTAHELSMFEAYCMPLNAVSMSACLHTRVRAFMCTRRGGVERGREREPARKRKSQQEKERAREPERQKESQRARGRQEPTSCNHHPMRRILLPPTLLTSRKTKRTVSAFSLIVYFQGSTLLAIKMPPLNESGSIIIPSSSLSSSVSESPKRPPPQ